MATVASPSTPSAKIIDGTSIAKSLLPLLGIPIIPLTFFIVPGRSVMVLQAVSRLSRQLSLDFSLSLLSYRLEYDQTLLFMFA